MVSLYRHIAKPVLMTQIGGWFYALKAFFFILALPYSKIYFKTTTNLHKLFILIPFFLWFHILFSISFVCIWDRFGIPFEILDFSSHLPQSNFEAVKVGSILKESKLVQFKKSPWIPIHEECREKIKWINCFVYLKIFLARNDESYTNVYHF